jgi:hypothetical protein
MRKSPTKPEIPDKSPLHASQQPARRDFENFGNLLHNDGFDRLFEDGLPMNPAGCDPNAWSLTVILPFYRRDERFDDVTHAIVASSARIDHNIFVLHRSPLESEILTKINEFEHGITVLRRNIRELIFRERLWTSKTGEDMTIPNVIRKYAGVNSNPIPARHGYQQEILNLYRSLLGRSPSVSIQYARIV